MTDPFQVVKDFEAALCEYTGAPYAVTTTSCTMALLLAVAWHLDRGPAGNLFRRPEQMERISIPKRTYVGVAQSIIHAGGHPVFRDEEWVGSYRLRPLPVWDCARIFTSGMYDASGMACVSFHWAKTLGIQQGGAILHDDPEADRWLRMARFDGREEGVAPKDQKEWIVGWHCYMAPATAAEGLTRLRLIPRHNDPLPNDDYPDLSTMDIFR